MRRLFMMLLSFLLLLACVPTPEEEVIAKKDFDSMLEKANGTPSENANEPDSMPKNGDRVSETFTGRSDAFKVTFDAEIILPEAPLPIVRVKPGEFNPENLQSYFEVLTKGEDFYLKKELESKEYLEKLIADMQAEVDAGLPSLDRDGLSEQDVQLEIEYWNAQIDGLKKRWEQASDGPGTPVKRLVDVNWESIPTYLGWDLTTLDEQARFSFRQNAEVRENDHVIPYLQSSVYYNNKNREPQTKSGTFQRYADVTGQTEMPNGTHLNLSPAEAQTEAERLIATIGIKDMAADRVYLMQETVLSNGTDGYRINEKLPADYEYRYLYEVRFCRKVNGISVAMPSYFGASDEQSELQYAPVWSYEELYVRLGNDGVCTFWYQAPIEIVETVTESATLKPFSEIIETAKKMLPIFYEDRLSSPYNYREMEFSIDRITLSLQRVMEKDNLDYGLLIPVWCFWGSDRHTESDGTIYTNEFTSEYGDPCGYIPLLCINAVDGSIIDPAKGY
ncbi:MAG: hypothetical protein II049_00305 [Clostridia bacterium]|nr:hypothetical protein [Clostridia bacterium]